MKRSIFVVLALVCGATTIYGQNPGQAHGQNSTENPGQTIGERLSRHVYTLASDSLAGREFGEQGAYQAARYVAARFAEIGLDTYTDSTYLQPFTMGGTQGYNVIGVVRGNTPALKDEWIILGAHLDHIGTNSEDEIYHGADDNASGVAVLIETARALAARRDELSRSVMFVAFDGEEAGLLGSRHLAQQLTGNPAENRTENQTGQPAENQPGQQTENPTENPGEGAVKYMASLDMVGWLREGEALKIAGVAMLDDGEDIFGKALENTGTRFDGLNLKLKKFDSMIFTGSDHDSFAARGIPATYITTGLKSPYHRPEDTADKIDYAGMALVADYMAATTVEMARRDELTPSGRRSLKHRDKEPRIEGGLMASIGSNRHIYKGGAMDGKYAFSWQAGVWGQVNLGKYGWFALRPGVVFEQRRALWPVDFANRTSSVFSTNAITVPLDVMLKARLGSPAVYIYAFAGGYYSRVLSGTNGGDRVNLSGAGALNRNEWGLRCGGGLRLFNVFIEGGGHYGLSRVLSGGGGGSAGGAAAGGGKISNQTSYFTVGYKF
ncbi:MAG: M20/M25/M40 family metallo-hydrolase [Alistipes sp.]|nr:M20/M25/M40 family metallo-hydrolase [Alistipes sp.]